MQGRQAQALYLQGVVTSDEQVGLGRKVSSHREGFLILQHELIVLMFQSAINLREQHSPSIRLISCELSPSPSLHDGDLACPNIFATLNSRTRVGAQQKSKVKAKAELHLYDHENCMHVPMRRLCYAVVTARMTMPIVFPFSMYS